MQVISREIRRLRHNRRRAVAARACWCRLDGRAARTYQMQRRTAAAGSESARLRGRGGGRPVMTHRLILHSLILSLLLVVIVGERGLSLSQRTVLPDPAPLADERVLAYSLLAPADSTVPLIVPLQIANPPRPVPLQTGPAIPLAPPVDVPTPITTPAFYPDLHHLAEGETLGDVARTYDISLDALIWANYLHTGDVLAVGQALRIPRLSGVPYQIQPGDTLDSIAAWSGVPAELIADYPPNDVQVGEPLPVGQEIFVPGGTRPLPVALLERYGSREALAARAAQPAGLVHQQQTNLREGPDTVYARVAQLEAGSQAALLARHAEWLKVEVGGQTGWVHRDLLDVPAGLVETLPETSNFPPPPPIWVWPTYGALTSGFGPRWGSFHNGIDIANSAWTPIYAARAGWVSEAGWCRGYGYCVRINHDGGIQTIYGHLVDQPVVRAGAQVAAGEVIGHMGSTYDAAGGGYSTGNHLHFTVTINGQAINPLSVLP